MERNSDDTFGTTGDVGSTTGGTGSFGSTGAGMAGTGAPAGGLEYGSTATTTDTGGTDTGRVDKVKQNVDEKLGKAKEKARELQSTLADRLDAGADKLRQRKLNAQSPAMAAATAGVADAGAATDDRMANVQDSVARGMTKSADWLRNGDLKGDIEHQVKENPGRTLLIALGVGYLLGKAFRGNR